MKNVLLAFLVVPLLTMPAFAGPLSAGDKPMIVAEDVGVEVGNVGVGSRRATPPSGPWWPLHVHATPPSHYDRHDDRR